MPHTVPIAQTQDRSRKPGLRLALSSLSWTGHELRTVRRIQRRPLHRLWMQLQIAESQLSQVSCSWTAAMQLLQCDYTSRYATL